MRVAPLGWLRSCTPNCPDHPLCGRVHGVQAPSALARSAHLFSWARSDVLCSFIGADIFGGAAVLNAWRWWPLEGEGTGQRLEEPHEGAEGEEQAHR